MVDETHRTQREHCWLVLFWCWVEKWRDQSVSLVKNTVVMNKLGKSVELVLGSDVNLPLGVLLNAVMINTTIIAQADASLTR